MEDAMTKALEVNDETPQHQERQPQPEAGDKKANLARQDKLEGKSFQVNENSVEEGESVSPDTKPKG
jgi:hypothetical protein